MRSFFFSLQSLFRSGSSGLCGFSFVRVVMVSLGFCVSSLRPVAVGVRFGCAGFELSGVFGGWASVRLLVWIGEESKAEAVSCSALCTNLQAASARCWGV